MITDYSEERRSSNLRSSCPVIVIQRVLLYGRVIRLLIDWRSYRGRRVARRILRHVFRIFRMSWPMMSYMGLRLWAYKKILKCIERTCTYRLRQHTCG